MATECATGSSVNFCGLCSMLLLFSSLSLSDELADLLSVLPMSLLGLSDSWGLLVLVLMVVPFVCLLGAMLIYYFIRRFFFAHEEAVVQPVLFRSRDTIREASMNDGVSAPTDTALMHLMAKSQSRSPLIHASSVHNKTTIYPVNHDEDVDVYNHTNAAFQELELEERQKDQRKLSVAISVLAHNGQNSNSYSLTDNSTITSGSRNSRINLLASASSPRAHDLSHGEDLVHSGSFDDVQDFHHGIDHNYHPHHIV